LVSQLVIKQDKNPIEIYQTEEGQTQIEVLLNNEPLWLKLQQIATLFDRDKSVISRHLSLINFYWIFITCHTSPSVKDLYSLT
jgi:hypothetical protein